MRRIINLTIPCVLLMTAMLSTSMFSQTTTSTIEGTIKDPTGALVPGATITVKTDALAAERTSTSNKNGEYRIAALPAGNYRLTVSAQGFAVSSATFELLLNRTLKFDVQLQVGASTQTVDVTSAPPLIDQTVSSVGATITPEQVEDLPVNGRDYLDLLQLVPGTTINRQADPEGDNANPILGERSGNNNFLIDGHGNKDTVNGGPAAQFNQETIAEFQVLTTGFKAEFGQASGAVVNVITKSGGNGYHGFGSLFHRNDAFDSSNALTPGLDAPELERFDYTLGLSGPLINPGFGVNTKYFEPLRDKAFFFASVERITENRQLAFEYPDLGSDAGAQTVLGILQNQENPIDLPSEDRETRAFVKLNQQLKRHSLSQTFNYTNGMVSDFLPFGSNALPSSRNNFGTRNLMLAFADTMLLGDLGNPYIVTLRGSYRDEPSDINPSHPEIGPTTLFNAYSVQNCPGCILFGDLPQVQFGNGNTPSETHQKYKFLSANVAKLFGDHNLKFGWNFMNTKAKGNIPKQLFNQSFTTIADFLQFGPLTSGISLISETGGLTPQDEQFDLDNDYNALYIQDDWRILNNLTLNLGLRWEYDSEFKGKKNFSPRVGAAWAINPKTVVRGNFGIFYDQFRLGLASRVPSFGGADERLSQRIRFPRGLYGSPSFVSSIAFLVGLPGGCFANNLTDAQITANMLTCPLAPGAPFIGVDRLNNVVAPGNPSIPANAVINVNNIQALTGLTPAQYLTQAAAAIGVADGYFFWDSFGLLSNNLLPPQQFPTRVDETFSTPNTLGYSFGFKREIIKDISIEVDYHHKDIRNLLGVRTTNLAYESRVDGIPTTWVDPFPGVPITSFGPYYEGKYDALVISFNKRLSNRFMFNGSYTYANATDNAIGINSTPSDSYVGIVPVVTEPGTGTTNANGSFTSTNGNFIAEAGTFWNGPDLDKGPSPLSVDHVFQMSGMVDLPWQFQISGIFRAQSGFHFSRQGLIPGDPDGNGNFNGIDLSPDAGRNAFTAPSFANLDLRFSKSFNIGDRVRAQLLFEFFNVMNRQNPGSVVTQHPDIATEPFGSINQVLPGREGQIGFRIEF